MIKTALTENSHGYSRAVRALSLITAHLLTTFLSYSSRSQIMQAYYPCIMLEWSSSTTSKQKWRNKKNDWDHRTVIWTCLERERLYRNGKRETHTHIYIVIRHET